MLNQFGDLSNSKAADCWPETAVVDRSAMLLLLVSVFELPGLLAIVKYVDAGVAFEAKHLHKIKQNRKKIILN